MRLINRRTDQVYQPSQSCTLKEPTANEIIGKVATNRQIPRHSLISTSQRPNSSSPFDAISKFFPPPALINPYHDNSHQESSIEHITLHLNYVALKPRLHSNHHLLNKKPKVLSPSRSLRSRYSCSILYL